VGTFLKLQIVYIFDNPTALIGHKQAIYMLYKQQ